jgi:hypothetical protein
MIRFDIAFSFGLFVFICVNSSFPRCAIALDEQTALMSYPRTQRASRGKTVLCRLVSLPFTVRPRRTRERPA